MGKNSSKICQEVRDSVPCTETDRSATCELFIDCAKTASKSEKERFPSTLRVDHSSFGAKKDEEQQQQQEPSAVCQDDVALQLASALRAALIQGDGSSSTCFPAYLHGSRVEFRVQVTRTSIPAAEPLNKESNVEPLKKDGKVDLPKKEGKVDLPKKQGKVDLPKKQGKVDLPKKQGKVVEPLKKESKVDSREKEGKVESQQKLLRACSDHRQYCGGAVGVSRRSRQSPVGNQPASLNDAAASARRPQPVGGDMLPAGLLPHVRHVTGGTPAPTYASTSTADVYRHYRRLRQQRERSSGVAAAWISGNNFGGNVGSVDPPVGMLYYGNPPLKRTEGDGAEKCNNRLF